MTIIAAADRRPPPDPGVRIGLRGYFLCPLT